MPIIGDIFHTKSHVQYAYPEGQNKGSWRKAWYLYTQLIKVKFKQIVEPYQKLWVIYEKIFACVRGYNILSFHTNNIRTIIFSEK